MLGNRHPVSILSKRTPWQKKASLALLSNFLHSVHFSSGHVQLLQGVPISATCGSMFINSIIPPQCHCPINDIGPHSAIFLPRLLPCLQGKCAPVTVFPTQEQRHSSQMLFMNLLHRTGRNNGKDNRGSKNSSSRQRHKKGKDDGKDKTNARKKRGPIGIREKHRAFSGPQNPTARVQDTIPAVSVIQKIHQKVISTIPTCPQLSSSRLQREIPQATKKIRPHSKDLASFLYFSEDVQHFVLWHEIRCIT